jgi:hypothetical protein
MELCQVASGPSSRIGVQVQVLSSAPNNSRGRNGVRGAFRFILQFSGWARACDPSNLPVLGGVADQPDEVELACNAKNNAYDR